MSTSPKRYPTELKAWFKQWQIDTGEAPGRVTEDQRRIIEPEAKVKEPGQQRWSRAVRIT